MPTLDTGSVPATLWDYLQYNSTSYGALPPDENRASVPWSKLLQMLFITKSISTQPPGSPSGFFTQTIALADETAVWQILAREKPTVTALSLVTKGFSPPKAPGSNSLTGTVVVGNTPQSVQIPLEGATDFTADASALTIGGMLDYFGGLIPGVGSLASSTLPCPIRAVGSTPLKAAVTGGVAQVLMDFGETPCVSFICAVNAADPVEQGVLQLMSLEVRDKTFRLNLQFFYYGATISITYPYEDIACPPKRPPPVPIDPIRLRQRLREFLRVAVGLTALASLWKYASLFSSDTSTAGLKSIAQAIVGAASDAGFALGLNALGAGLFGAFGTTLANPPAFVEIIFDSGLDKSKSPLDLAACMHAANPDYTVTDVATALKVVPTVDPLLAAQSLAFAWGEGLKPIDGGLALVNAFGMTDKQADLIVLMRALSGSRLCSTPGLLAIAVRGCWPHLPATDLAQAMAAALPPLDKLVSTLLSAGYSYLETSVALNAVMGQRPCALFVKDLNIPNPIANEPPTAAEMASCCFAAGYRYDVALFAMRDTGSFPDVLQALTEAFGFAAYALGFGPQANSGGMKIQQSMDVYGCFSLGTPFTIEVDFILDAQSSGNLLMWQAMGSVTPASDRLQLLLSGTGLDLFVQQNGGQNTSQTGTDYGLDSRPHTFAVVCQGANGDSSPEMDLLIDGQVIAQERPLTPPLFANGVQANFGLGPYFGSLGGGLKGHGIIALRLWNQSLSPAQLAHNSQFVTSASQTIGCWYFQDDSPTQPDKSPMGGVGSIGGGAALKPLG